jgi:hypothetical protein
MRYRLRTLMIVLAVLSVYMAAYSALMQQAGICSESAGGIAIVDYFEPHYRLCDPALQIIFWPMAYIDQRARSGVWRSYLDEEHRRLEAILMKSRAANAPPKGTPEPRSASGLGPGDLDSME